MVYHLQNKGISGNNNFSIKSVVAKNEGVVNQEVFDCKAKRS